MANNKVKAYGITVPFVDVPPEAIFRTVAPTSADKNAEIGQEWIHKTGDARTAYIFGGLDSSGDAVWILAGPGDSDVDQLAGDTGTATPSTGSINILGGTNVTTTGGSPTADDLTIDLDDAISLSTSVTSPLYTVGSADLQIQGDASNDVVVTLGDNGGSTNFIVEDSDNSDLFTVVSDGTISFTSLTVTGNFAQTGGTFAVGQDNASNAIDIGGGTTARAIGIGNSAAAHTLTLGALTGAASTDIQFGTGNFTLDGAATGTVTIGASMTSGTLDIGGTSQTGTFTLGGSDGAMTMNIANADGAKTINIGAGVDGNTISIGNGVNTSAQTVNIANGNSGDDSTVSILSGTGTAGTGTLNLGNNTRITAIDVGDVEPAASRTITVGGGTVTTAAVTDTIDIGPDGATTNSDSVKTVNVNIGGVTTGQVLTNIASGAITSGTHTVSIQTGNAAAGTVATNISTGTGTKTVSLGNSDAGTTFNVDATTLINDSVNANTSINTGTSTGTISVGNGSAGAITVDSSSTLDVNVAGALNIDSSGGAISIGTDDVDQNASFATDGVRTVTVGSSNGASDLVLQAGTGEITVTGTVKEISAEFLEASGDEITSFSQSPLLTTAADTAGVATGSGGDVNLMYLQQGVLMEQFMIGTQTIIGPRMDSNGLLVSLDLTDTDGVEYNFGAARTNSRHAFTIGTDAAFFFEVGLYINDMDGSNPYVIGFRRSAANDAVMADYTDYATIGMNSGTSATNIVTMTELNGGGQTITNTTDAWGGDGSTNTLRVLVDGSGNVTYTINGTAPSSSVAFQFDNGDVVCPFIHLLHNANATEVDITSLKVGFQA